MTDVVGVWDVSLADGVHTVKFEHGTTTGKRVLNVDGHEVLRHNWMFKLVGKENFKIGKTSAYIAIEAISGFAYEYTLFIDGKPLKKFTEDRKKSAKVWTFILDGVETRVVLGENIFLKRFICFIQLLGVFTKINSLLCLFCFVLLEKDMMDVWVNGEVLETAVSFLVYKK